MNDIKYTDEPLVSVIISSYNKENLIMKTVRSIQNQSLKNIEIIIVDDCSTDNSSSLYKYLLETDPRIRIFKHSKNLGVWRSRLDGFLYSNSKYIIHFDMGDLYINNYALEEYYNIVTKYKLDSLRFSSYTYRNASTPFNYEHALLPTIYNKIMYGESEFDVTTFEHGTIWNRLIRGNILTKGLLTLDTIILNAYKNLYEDRWFNTLVNKFNNGWVMTNRPGYFYSISFTGEGTIKTGNKTVNDKTIHEFIYFWVFDLKLLPKENNKKSVIDNLKNYNKEDNTCLGTKVNLSFITSKFQVYEYLLNSLIEDPFVSNKDKDFLKFLYKNYLNQIKD